MIVRQYRPGDCRQIVRLFYNTVHTVNAKDYTPRQLNAWADRVPDPALWNSSLSRHYTLVAEEGDKIVGFGDIDDAGYLDRLFVHRDCQSMGIASALCEGLEKHAGGRVFTHASITARPFFEKRGYRVLKSQQVERKGIFLTNFVMEKHTD